MGDLPRIQPEYAIYDKSFNFSSSEENQSSKVVLFCLDPETEEFIPKERYLLKMTKTDEELMTLKQKSSKRKSEIKLLKRPIDEILLEIKEEEEKEKVIESTGMEVEPIQNTSGNTLLNKHTPKRFIDLLGNDQSNRYLLKWLKSWDNDVFKKKKYRFERRTAEMEKFFGNRRTSFNKFTGKNKFSKKKKIMSLRYKTQQMMEDLQLDIKEDCQKLKNMIPLICGPPGSGKTSLAATIAKHCKYNPTIVRK